MRLLSLCSGIGGIDLAATWAGMEIAGQVEINAFRIQVLEKRFPGVKRMKDIKEVKGDEFGAIDIVAGGIPCTPFSLAGKRRGQNDDRYLWPYALAIIAEAKPTWVLIENVDGFVSLGLDQVAADLEGEEYEVRAFVLPACAVGAPHQRKRCFVVAYSSRHRRGKRENQQEHEPACSHSANAGLHGEEGALANTDLGQCEGWRQFQSGREQVLGGRDVWPNACRCGEILADAAGERLSRRGSARIAKSTTQATRGMESEPKRCGAMADTDLQRRQECSAAAVAAGAGIGSWSSDEAVANSDSTRGSLPTTGQFAAERITQCHTPGETQSGVGGVLDGLSSWLDRYRWPAGPGCEQYSWEPPRTVKGKVPKRRARLEALGDSVVPQQVYPLLAEIYRIEMGRL